MTTLTIRSFDSGDMLPIRAVLREIGWEERYIQGQLDCIGSLAVSDTGRVLVAETGGALVGYVSVQFAAWNRLGRIHGLVVSPAHRRQGIGSALVHAAEQFIQQYRGRGIYVDTPVSNEGARWFYAEIGYRHDHTMTDYYDTGLDGVTHVKFFPATR